MGKSSTTFPRVGIHLSPEDEENVDRGTYFCRDKCAEKDGEKCMWEREMCVPTRACLTYALG